MFTIGGGSGHSCVMHHPGLSYAGDSAPSTMGVYFSENHCGGL